MLMCFSDRAANWNRPWPEGLRLKRFEYQTDTMISLSFFLLYLRNFWLEYDLNSNLSISYLYFLWWNMIILILCKTGVGFCVLQCYSNGRKLQCAGLKKNSLHHIMTCTPRSVILSMIGFIDYYYYYYYWFIHSFIHLLDLLIMYIK